MEDITSLKDKYKDDNFMIIGAGGTLFMYKNKIIDFIRDNNPIVIGINNMSEMCTPDYHLWTNTKRYIDFGGCISNDSCPIFSHKFSDKLITTHWDKNFLTVFYQDKKGIPISIKGKYIKGHFRTAGCLAIMIAYVWGAKNIHIAGMDGYTYIGGDENVKGQHFYGEGMTDSSDWQLEKKKDDMVYEVLRNIRDFGVSFSIITPTVFKDFYNNLWRENG